MKMEKFVCEFVKIEKSVREFMNCYAFVICGSWFVEMTTNYVHETRHPSVNRQLAIIRNVVRELEPTLSLHPHAPFTPPSLLS